MSTERQDNLKQRCDWLLTALVGKNLVDAWWNSKNRAFDMKTPQSVFESDPERVYNYLLKYREYQI